MLSFDYFLSYNSVYRICFQFSLITCVGSHGLLQQGNPEYDAKRQQLYEYYHPLEFSATIPIEEKTRLMEEWYVKIQQLCCLHVTLVCFNIGVIVAYKHLNEINELLICVPWNVHYVG
jgi:hypothetical protein